MVMSVPVVVSVSVLVSMDNMGYEVDEAVVEMCSQR